MPAPGVTIFDSNGNTISASGGALSVTATVGTGVQAPQATTNVAVAASASNTTVGSATGMTFTDSGVVIAALTTAQVAAIGTVQINVPFTTNLVVVGNALNASISVAIGF
jgi:hypothetical protein